MDFIKGNWYKGSTNSFYIKFSHSEQCDGYRRIYFDEKNGRVKFTKEQRTKLLTKFNNKCNTCQCCIDDNKFHIDHITSLAGGGTNEETNLQVLCLSCHRDKCSSEHEQGQYIKPKETASFFNSEVRDIMNSDLSQQHAFIEKAYYGEVDKDKKLFCIDINKCRRNILKYSNFDFKYLHTQQVVPPAALIRVRERLGNRLTKVWIVTKICDCVVLFFI